jgi:hypothetical protein
MITNWINISFIVFGVICLNIQFQKPFLMIGILFIALALMPHQKSK